MEPQAPELSGIIQAAIESTLLGGPRDHDRISVAERSGVPSELARSLWVSLGFPAMPDDAVEFTDADVDALRAVGGLRLTAETDPRLLIASARAVGQSMARLAEWQADMVTAEIRTRLTEAQAAAGSTPIDAGEVARQAAEHTLAMLEQLQTYAWRRHLAAVVSRAADITANSGESIRPLAVGFADMVGYTRLTRHLYPDELTTLLETFEASATEAITEHGGWVIKNVGDEVMFAAETPAAGAAVALAIQHNTENNPDTPQLRVGLAYGPVLARFGDLYGSVVNIAARLTGIAQPGTVLIDDQAAAELADNSHYALRPLRSVRVRGFSRLRSHVLRAAPTE